VQRVVVRLAVEVVRNLVLEGPGDQVGLDAGTVRRRGLGRLEVAPRHLVAFADASPPAHPRQLEPLVDVAGVRERPARIALAEIVVASRETFRRPLDVDGARASAVQDVVRENRAGHRLIASEELNLVVYERVVVDEDVVEARAAELAPEADAGVR